MGREESTLESLVIVKQSVLSDFWKNKRVFLTGHTGFKGSWLSIWLHKMGARVTGYALAPEGKNSIFDEANLGEMLNHHIGDVNDFEYTSRVLAESQAEIVIHFAAQALVRKSYHEPLNTFSTNIMGTANVLEAVRCSDSVKAVLVITTDKVYRNNEWMWPYREEDHLGGHDPYSASKAGAELVADCYRNSYLKEKGVALATARAGNVIGGGDWSEDRLIPDAIRAWSKNETLLIRNPSFTRPWQHVMEPLSGYLCLVQKLWEDTASSGAYNFGPDTSDAATVGEVVSLASRVYGAEVGVEFARNKADLHEAGWLALEVAKARTVLNYTPNWGLQESVERTISWYKKFLSKESVRELCLQDIEAWEESR